MHAFAAAAVVEVGFPEVAATVVQTLLVGPRRLVCVCQGIWSTHFNAFFGSAAYMVFAVTGVRCGDAR